MTVCVCIHTCLYIFIWQMYIKEFSNLKHGKYCFKIQKICQDRQIHSSYENTVAEHKLIWLSNFRCVKAIKWLITVYCLFLLHRLNFNTDWVNYLLHRVFFERRAGMTRKQSHHGHQVLSIHQCKSLHWNYSSIFQKKEDTTLTVKIQ